MTDLAGVFSESEREQLVARLREYERETSHQIAVLTVPGLQGESIDAFSLRVANAWGVGHSDLDNGILITVSPVDRQARIEIGLGLESTVSDETAREILYEQMFPSFQRSEFPAGIEAGAAALMVEARRLVIPPDRWPTGGDG